MPSDQPTLTPAQVAELEGKLAKMTPGEWVASGLAVYAGGDWRGGRHVAHTGGCAEPPEQAVKNADGIAALCKAAPALLALARRVGEAERRADAAEAEAARLRDVVGRLIELAQWAGVTKSEAIDDGFAALKGGA